MSRYTKIVATIGPASSSATVLRSMMAAGMDVARIGLAHGTLDENVATIERIRAVAAEEGRIVGILADLPGPKVRAGRFADDGGAVLVEDQRCTLVLGDGPSTPTRITVDGIESFIGLHRGDRVTLGDGAVLLEVEQASATSLTAIVRNGGRVQGNPGVHLPAETLHVRSPTAEDMVLLERMCDVGVDIVAVSFVRAVEDVRVVQRAVGPDGPMVMAKIETPNAVADLRAIVSSSDAVMVARGDLGIELPLEDVPHLQKRIIRHCVAFGKPVLTATQMLESMIHAATPTRAEASDVANAVFDGTDALMLSGETAIGRDPAGVVATMARIAQRAESEAGYSAWGRRLGKLPQLNDTSVPLTITDAVTRAAWGAAISVGATAIIACTRSGATARAMARFRPQAPLVGLSPNPRVVRQLTLSWGVLPVEVPEHHSADDLVWLSVEQVCKLGYVSAGDLVVVLAGSPVDPEPVTDNLRIVRVR